MPAHCWLAWVRAVQSADGVPDLVVSATDGRAPGSPIPLYHKVSSILRARISDGIYAAGQQMPTEDLLMAEFQVSKATIRQAVGELVDSGLVSRKQGKGTFVLPSVVHRVRKRYTGSASDQVSETPGTRLRDVSVEHDAPLPARVAELLQLEPPIGTLVRRTREIEGQVYCYSVNYLPAHLGRHLSRGELRRQTLTGILQQHGVHLGRGVTWIRAELVDPGLSEQLEVPFGTPTLAVERLIRDVEDFPVEVVRSWYRSDVYEYTVVVDQIGPD